MENSTTIKRDLVTEEKKPVLVAIYCRKSNSENLDGSVTSIDNQKAACRNYIQIYKEKGWQECAETFDDPAESGKDLKRPAMQRLLKAVNEETIQGVIVYKIDRLTRSSRDFHHLMELFEKHNVAFVSATESIDTKSPQGRLMVNIMVQFAQYDRELDQERSKDFHLARARKGLWCAGLPPLGYDIKDKMLVINAKEAQLVRDIFDLYLRYESAMRVAEELNHMGYRRKIHKTEKGKLYGGKHFDMDSVVRILERKVYIGFITNNRTGQEFPSQHKPIIPPRVFEKAQELLASHNHRGGEIHYALNRHGFRLKGIIRCGECGSAVVGHARPKKGKVYRYYRCLAQQNGLPIQCSFKSVGSDKVEEFVIEKLASVGWDRSFLEMVVKKAVRQARQKIGPLQEEKWQIESRLQEIQTSIQNLINLAKEGSSSQEAAKELKELEEAKKALEARSAEIETQLAHRKRVVYDVDTVQGALQRFARFIYKIPIELQIQTIRLMVRQVTLYKDRIDVQLHELAVTDLQRALNGKEPSQEGKFTSRRFLRREAPNATALLVSPSDGELRVAELEQNWRGRRDLNPRSLA